MSYNLSTEEKIIILYFVFFLVLGVLAFVPEKYKLPLFFTFYTIVPIIAAYALDWNYYARNMCGWGDVLYVGWLIIWFVVGLTSLLFQHWFHILGTILVSSPSTPEEKNDEPLPSQPDDGI
jgi:hypothetical protein